MRELDIISYVNEASPPCELLFVPQLIFPLGPFFNFFERAIDLMKEIDPSSVTGGQKYFSFGL